MSQQNQKPGIIPACPTRQEGVRKDVFVRDRDSEKEGRHGGLPQYRSIVSGTRVGNQCVYNSDGSLNKDPKIMGTADFYGLVTSGGADGEIRWPKDLEEARQSLHQVSGARLIGHLVFDFVPYKASEEFYNDVQERMRNKGIASGTDEGGPFTDAEFDRALRESLVEAAQAKAHSTKEWAQATVRKKVNSLVQSIRAAKKATQNFVTEKVGPVVSCPLKKLQEGKPVPLHDSDDKQLIEGGGEGSRARTLRGNTYDNSRPKRKFRRENNKPDKNVSVGVSHDWVNKEGALKRFGDDKNNFELVSYGYALNSGYTHDKDGHKLDVIRASAHAEAASFKRGAELFGDAVEVGASAKALAVEAEASVGAEWSKKAKELHAKAGASADLVKGELGGAVKIPFFGHTITIGGGVEGQIGASAEASASAGWSEKQGWHVGAKAKAGLGLGGGVNFSIGFL